MTQMVNELAIPWVPHGYQQRGVEVAVNDGCANIWLKPGRGKTAICLEVIRRVREWDKRPALVVCPLRPAYLVWPREAQKWEQFCGMNVSVLHGPEKGDRLRKGADIFVINFDGLKWLHKTLGTKWPFSILIIDESTALKNTDTQRFKIIKEIVNYIPRRLCLTGTPAPNSLIDVFGPQYAVDRGATFGRFLTQYKNKYFQQSGFNGYTWTLQQGAEEAIYDALAPCTIQIESDDDSGTPDVIFNQVKVTLGKEARELYKSIERALFAELEEGSISAVNAAVALMKCQQIANGSVYLDRESDTDPRKVQEVHDAKLDTAVEIVEELNGQGAIIAYHFKHDLLKLRKAFPKALVMADAKNEAQLQRIQDMWNSGDYDVLLLHPASAGHGLNLQEHGAALIWYSLTYSRELFDQLNARLARQGSKRESIVCHMIYTEKTVDEDILAALENKGAGQDALLAGVKARNSI